MINLISNIVLEMTKVKILVYIIKYCTNEVVPDVPTLTTPKFIEKR